MSSSNSISGRRSDSNTNEESSEMPQNDAAVIPSPSQVVRTFAESKYLWQGLLARANAMAMQSDTVRLLDLAGRVPEMPDSIAGIEELAGRATWRMESTCCDDCAPNVRTGQIRKWDLLWYNTNRRCEISNRSCFSFSDSKSNGLGLLFSGWAYILRMKCLEWKGYNVDALPKPKQFPPPREPESSSEQDGSSMTVDLGSASEAEVQWWVAILSPDQKWEPTWAGDISYTGNIKFRVTANVKAPVRSATPFIWPSSAEAVGLLDKFASMYNLQGQASLALAMALTLPLHGLEDMVQLPKPLLVRDDIQSSASSSVITNEYASLSRYMTLSSNPGFMASALWSTFWEPGIDSNLVTPWFDAIVEVIKPLIDGDDLERLGHLMALRRPNLAPLWYGVTACGQTKLIKKDILKFLKTLQTPMVSRPIPEVAAWTRSPHSFMDLSGSGPYINSKTGEVSRADVWRLRHECWDVEPEGIWFQNPPFCPWPPFGSMPVDEIELRIHHEVYDARHRWVYSGWTWFLGDRTEVVHALTTGEGNAWSELEGNVVNVRLPEVLPPECMPPLGYTPDYVASEAAVGAIFRWAATEMEVTGKDIYTHPWVDGLADLESWENEEAEVSRASGSTEGPPGLGLERIEDWMRGVRKGTGPNI